MTHYQLLGKILKDVREDMSDDELTELLLENKISVSDNKKITFGQRASDKLAEFAGSWFFIIAFTLFLIIWVLINVYFLKNPLTRHQFLCIIWVNEAKSRLANRSFIQYDKQIPTAHE